MQVTSNSYGAGTVVDQVINKITVQFDTVTKSFILDKRYSARPRFENDEEIVEAFTAYGAAQERIKRIREQIQKL